ncbi:uncharacterized protein (TIGR02231 family) [Sulfitobacter undariae]|uniref:Uncharacterized protein (TIGR02231 family) n=1 Tax=Sulfitobacter undariae TaxID=1563671 RepID=A0A7W6E969_9RHOB|nr:DUF4139 domain-containing protein [Sulfitobacter undariae]MBB3994305.1 uncharacterized protein (TIGR02231 family) [Sulfitobacter undariae]
MRFISLALAALPLPALADTYSVSSAPTAVTVYNGYAMVTREVSVDVSAGTHELVFPDLPKWIEAASLRVNVAGAQLGSTRLRTDSLPPQPDADSPAVIAAKEQIEKAELALRDLEDRVEDASLTAQAAESRLAFLRGIATQKDLPAAPEDLANIAQMIEAQTLAARQALLASKRAARSINEDREDLVKAIKDAHAALASLTPPAEPKALLALSVAASEAGSVTASISYPANASWEPTYDVVLTRGDAESVTLRRAALIYQRSGENWNDVTLTLSTLAPTGQVLPSELYPTLLQFSDKQSLQKLGNARRGSISAEMAAAPAAMMDMVEPTPLPTPNFDGPGVTYTLPNTLTIAQNAEAARIEMDALSFDARVFARAVPVRDQTAFMMAEATNTSQEPLLAASIAQIFVDGSLIGRSSFASVPAGGEFVQSFGPIEDLRLTHAILDQSEGDRGLIKRSNIQVQQVRMTLENIGSKTWDVEVMASVPYSEQEDLVIKSEAKPAATLKDVDDRRGLMQWDLSLAANATQEIIIDQDIRWPDGNVLH